MVSDTKRELLNCTNVMACACLVRPAESDFDMHPHILRSPGRSSMLKSESVMAYQGLDGLYACMHVGICQKQDT